MYVSLHISPQSSGDQEDPEIIDEIASQAAVADAAGVAAICLTEHHLAGFNTYADPFLMGAYLSAKLTQAYIGVHVAQVPLRHPVRVVESANMLDLLMRGRFMLGVSPGAARQIEFDAFGVDVGMRSEIADHRIDAMIKAWAWQEADPPLDLSAPHVRGVLAGRISPTSYRKPHPLIGRATKTESTIAATARRGWPVLLGLRGDDSANRREAAVYRDSLARSDHSPQTVQECLAWLGFLSMICVAETEREARRRLAEFAELGGQPPILPDGAPVQRTRAAKDWKDRQLSRARQAVAGTPEMIVEHLLTYRDLGVEHARVSLLTTSGMSEQNADDFRLFIDEVLPRLDPRPLPGPVRTVYSEASQVLPR